MVTVQKKNFLNPIFFPGWAPDPCQLVGEEPWPIQTDPCQQLSNHINIDKFYSPIFQHPYPSISSSVKSYCEGEIGSDPTPAGWSQVLWEVKLQKQNVPPIVLQVKCYKR